MTSDTAARWQAAIVRAIDEQISARQIKSTRQWIANSGRDPSVAYLIDVYNGVAQSCECEAGQRDDPVCKHRAAFYRAIGRLPIYCAECGQMILGDPIIVGPKSRRSARCTDCTVPKEGLTAIDTSSMLRSVVGSTTE